MAKASKTSAQDNTPEQPYTFPTIGDGITVMARTQEEANEKAAEIKQNLATYGSPKPPKAKGADAGE
jgi:hypothetical protein